MIFSDTTMIYIHVHQSSLAVAGQERDSPCSFVGIRACKNGYNRAWALRTKFCEQQYKSIMEINLWRHTFL